MVSTKIEVSHNKLARIEDLDELARILFPGNQYQLSRRVLETVRAKMRRLGLIDHVSRFNQKYGYREGWVFSNKFSNALNRLADLTAKLREQRHPSQERKDRDSFGYL